MILLVIVLAARGCGKISHRTPEGVVEGYIKAAAAGKNKKMQGCYSADKLSDEAKTEISSTIKYSGPWSKGCKYRQLWLHF